MDFPQDLMDEGNKLVKLMKDGCLMIFKEAINSLKSIPAFQRDY